MFHLKKNDKEKLISEGKETQEVKSKASLGSEAKETRVKGKYKLSELLEGITEENRHEEMITDRQGREKI